MITNGQARRIASEWHGGQASALYSLASCGAIQKDHARLEIAVCLVHTDRALSDAPAQMREQAHTNRRELQALDDYVKRHGTRGPVAGWAKLWDDTEVAFERLV